MGVFGRFVCGVVGILFLQSGVQYYGQYLVGLVVFLFYCFYVGSVGLVLVYWIQMDILFVIFMFFSLQIFQIQEQNGILDWFRKLCLYKYYFVFKQFFMEKFLSFIEEDLNKFEFFIMGVKKKFKIQLELEKEKLERWCLNFLVLLLVISSGVV